MTIIMKCLWRLLTARRPQWLSTNPPPGHKADSQANFEVERKFRLNEADLDAVRGRLATMGFAPSKLIQMSDQFLPVKIKGEMLRIRDESVNGHSETLLTIKEWVLIKGGQGGKERSEEEGTLGPFARAFLLHFGRLLSGHPLHGFSKLRQEHVSPSYPGVVITLDDVDGLGRYSGRYAEIEVLVPRDGDVEAARAKIAQLAKSLFDEERAPVEYSYQQMLEKSLTEA